jgi:uncharacterized ParB-like nuclease family protein
MTLEMVPIKRVRIDTRLRDINEQQVETLVDSIAEVGLLNPITVQAGDVVEGGVAVPGYWLVAGAHRLEACKRLGLAEIEANIVDLSRLKRQLAECDENLAGTNLSKAERAMFTQRRKEIYEALHPETRAGVFKGNQHTDVVAENFAATFAKDTAERTGRSERSVRMDASRGSKISPDVLRVIAGTDLDTGASLDKIARLPVEQQRRVASDMKMADEPLNDFEVEEKQLAALMAAWNKAGMGAREKFLARIDQPVFDKTRNAR